mmetsp:Transcript_9260/g.21648  ORF Transcript_9260/g.21648 Transcript_9260/m.21648 type:complete len:204 (-) Transcript_9260:400-1011(-)
MVMRQAERSGWLAGQIGQHVLRASESSASRTWTSPVALSFMGTKPPPYTSSLTSSHSPSYWLNLSAPGCPSKPLTSGRMLRLTVWLAKSLPGRGHGTPDTSVRHETRGRRQRIIVSSTRAVSQHSLGSPPEAYDPSLLNDSSTMWPGPIWKSCLSSGNCRPTTVMMVPPSSGPKGGSTERIRGTLSVNHSLGRYGSPTVRKKS